MGIRARRRRRTHEDELRARMDIDHGVEAGRAAQLALARRDADGTLPERGATRATVSTLQRTAGNRATVAVLSLQRGRTKKKAATAPVAGVVVRVTTSKPLARITNAALGDGEQAKVDAFLRMDGATLPAGKPIADFIKDRLGDCHLEFVKQGYSVRIGGRHRLEFRMHSANGVLSLEVFNIGNPTYSH